ncbi:murein L,D-transpeptidase catalytic domain-containing protein [Flavobacterium fluviatile]|uniref:murein L,D-transpeptidase catalytic domain-containing protein n=1 Tax=Flavobacterium fluviatile TaxID=1862387 RepID=UPI0013D7CCBE|nr:murein L,D-transpeptidase catalytic domain family protein [Flavobacterium fluviatile]
MKIFNLILVVILSGFFISSKPYFKDEPNSLEIERINFRIDEMKSRFLANSKYNSKIAFFVDMRIPSGKNRFFVYDLQNNKIIDQGLVAHGCGSETGIKGQLKFSNVPNSNSTSLGKYSIGSNYNGIFGKAYRLHGLEETNSNAFKRAIVLHHYSAVPYEEQDHYISRSHGCPMVNEQFFKRIEKIIDSSKSNILLDIYY